MNPVVLLVDVRSASREELKSFLPEPRCGVVAAHYADSAVGYCRQLQPDLVLLFDNLPETSSFSLCRRLKKDPFNQLTPVVLIKSSLDQWDIHRGHDAGAYAVCATPSSLSTALQPIRPLLRLQA